MINIAILGYGVVGSGVGILCREQAAHIRRRCGLDVDVKYVLDLRAFPGDPLEARIVHDADLIFNDPQVQVVVETIGGVKAAYEFTKQALAAGKHVVSSNKELVATHGMELLALAKANGVHYRFEAAVGGGIPLLVTLREALAVNEIRSLDAILNGTSNYILTHMNADHDFDTVLSEAQRLGYAEKDPTDDVEGLDTARKLAILASMCSAEAIGPERIHTEGIGSISNRDAQIAKMLSSEIKLLARLEIVEAARERRYSLLVAPHLVPESHPLAMARDVFNAALLKGNQVEDILLYGRGAGARPTASAVWGDIIDVSRSCFNADFAELWAKVSPQRVVDFAEHKMSCYLRIANDISQDTVIKVLGALGEPVFRERAFEDEYLVELITCVTEEALAKATSGLPRGSLRGILRKL